MVTNFKIPVIRRLLIEKYVFKNIKLTENLFILDFLDNKNNTAESFLVFSDTIYPLQTLEETILPGIYQFNKKTKWEPIDLFIYENVGIGNGKKFLKWINVNNPKAQNMTLTRCYNNHTKSNEIWFLYGCLIESIFGFRNINNISKMGLGITITINHCSIEFIET